MNKPLSSGKCEPCNGNTPKLDYQEISKFLSELNDWSVNDFILASKIDLIKS